MRIILIDPGTHTVAELEHDGQIDWRDIQRYLGGCPLTVAGVLPTGDTLYCDDEGLLHGPRDFFSYPTINFQPLAGLGVITGPEDGEGNIMDARVTLEEVKASVLFLGRMQATRMTQKVTEHPGGVHIHVAPTIEPC